MGKGFTFKLHIHFIENVHIEKKNLLQLISIQN